MKELIPNGVRTQVFDIIIDDLIDLLEGPNGEYVLGAILARKLKVNHIVKNLKDERS